MGVKKLHLSSKGNSFFVKNLLNYLNDVWLSWDTTKHGSVPIISTNSAKDNTAEEVKYQAHVSKISINSNFLFNNDTNKHLE